MKIAPIVLSGFYFIQASFAATPEVISYDSLPGLVGSRNENVQAAQSSLKAKEKRTGSFTRSFLPSLSVEVGGEEFKAGRDAAARRENWKVSGELNLFRGGRDRLEGKIREEETLGARAELQKDYADELKVARQTFWKLVAVNQILAQRAEGLEKNKTSLKAAQKRAGAGTATAADTIQFELHDTLLRQDLKKLELERDLLRNRLSVAIGRDDHEGFVVPKEFPHPPDHLLVWPALDLERNASVAMLRAKERAEQLGISKANYWWMPKIDAYANYGLPSLSEEYTRALRFEKEWVAGIRFGLDFGQGVEARNLGQAKTFEAEAAQKRASRRIREAMAEDHELRHNLTLLHELLHDADADIKKAERFLKLTELEYTRGVKNGPDMLGAFQRYYDFLQRRTELYREFHGTQAELFALLATDAAE